MKKCVLFFMLLIASKFLLAQDMMPLINKIKAKLDKVNDYVAQGKMKTNVLFIKAPLSKIKVYYKKPDRFKIKKDGGISVLPKGGVSVNMGSVLTEANFAAIAAGETNINGTQTKIVKLLPLTENSDVVLTTLYIDEPNLLIKKATTTTKENGTYDMVMSYGKYAAYSLPDKVMFSFDAKEYKMPRGVTLEFNDAEKPSPTDKLKSKKGKVELDYSSYIINQGVDDSVFK